MTFEFVENFTIQLPDLSESTYDFSTAETPKKSDFKSSGMDQGQVTAASRPDLFRNQHA